MTKAIEDAANALAIRTALGVPTNAELAAVSDVADAAYVKPVDGIPHNDLHTGIRDQLDLADTALQPGMLPVGTTVTAAQISDSGAAGRTLLQKATLPEIQYLVSGGVKAVPPFDGIQYDLKMLGAGRVLTLPNPYPGQVHAPIHPSIVESRTGFGGYRYWLAYTPYPGYASLYENPCVAASNNLVDWFEPATNPLVAVPAGSPATGYNADTHIAFNANESELHLIFRERLFPSGNSVQHMSTTDGKTWSSRVALFGGAIGTQDVASPSLWWTGAKWRIISHNLDNALRPLELWESSSSDIRSVYTKLTTVGIAAEPGRLWWHTHVVAQSDGSLIGLAQDNDGSSGAPGELYVIHSGDGGFSFAKRRLAGAASGNYRSALLPQVGGALAIVSDYGTLSLSVKNLQATPYNSSALPVTASAVFDDVALADNFNRADSTTIGTSSSGVGYSPSTWGILSNKAYAVTSGVCVINSGKADHSVFAKLHSVETNNGQVWLVVRRPSASDVNFWRMGMSGNTLTRGITLVLQCVVAGAVASTYVCGGVSPGDRFGVIAIGHALLCVINGAVGRVVIDARNSTGMFCGLQGNASTNMLIDDLVIRTV